jgi:hypothetical protein
VFKVRFAVRGSWFVVLGSGFWVRGSWFVVLGSFNADGRHRWEPETPNAERRTANAELRTELEREPSTENREA